MQEVAPGIVSGDAWLHCSSNGSVDQLNVRAVRSFNLARSVRFVVIYVLSASVSRLLRIDIDKN